MPDVNPYVEYEEEPVTDLKDELIEVMNTDRTEPNWLQKKLTSYFQLSDVGRKKEMSRIDSKRKEKQFRNSARVSKNLGTS